MCAWNYLSNYSLKFHISDPLKPTL